ncbi:DUF3769 domain-containing protein [Cyanobium sp. LEGE 06113]|uniref:DUF3769 domain-containing protein n=1 Tax=Cyanobium sp. LEGE 06113 TaxID=1297573 RepID=UPI00187DEA31|nr:DUF3769 domain-containing protein [Cyanobium sp. LEGE 06113]MBE9154445.1 DUF3769 domain-containing protein [Cyanobium sp. LEGE 06113]
MRPHPGRLRQRRGTLLAALAVLSALAPAVGTAAPTPIDSPRDPSEAEKAADVLPPASAEAPADAGQQPAEPRLLVVRSDRQSYDRASGTLTVSGNVEARFDGWRLLADRIELRDDRRSVLATGQLRLIRGDQMLQAGSLRYNDWEGSGSITDVYGVVDQETLARDFEALRPMGVGLQGLPEAPATEPGAAAPAPDPGEVAVALDDSFACPELTADPQARPLLELLPPRRRPQPTMPAPVGCPGGDASPRNSSLGQILNDVALEPRAPGESLGTGDLPAADQTAGEQSAGEQGQQPGRRSGPAVPDVPIDQRVSGVRYRQSQDTTIKLDLAPLIEQQNDAPGGVGSYRPRPPKEGPLTRLRFQATSIRIQRDGWFADAVAFTNDPFTPAKAWIYARGVEARIRPDGVTSISSRDSRILLGDRFSVRGLRDAQIGQQQSAFSLDSDRRDRDGVYLGYNLPPLRLGREGVLRLQPQLMIQRAIEDRTESYVRPGTSLAGPDVLQQARFGDLFGMAALLDVPVGRFRLLGDASLSTFNPDNFRAGTRSNAQLSTPLALPGHSSSQGALFGSYRERIYNGSLGLQTLVYSYGAELQGEAQLTGSRADDEPPQGTPYFTPLRLNWRALSGNYQAALFDTDNLDTQWRSVLRGGVNGSLRLWENRDGANPDTMAQLRYAPIPVIPGLGLDFGINGSTAFYQDGAQQNTLTLAAGPSFTIGRFERPVLDYTRFSASLAGTLLDGGSPFGFDRAVDLRTVSFNAAQQIYGPLVLEAGATINIDSRSRFNGDVSYSYVELKLQQRAYEVGIFYSPYDGIGGIRIRLNDFDFTGSGTPFVPRPQHRGG